MTHRSREPRQNDGSERDKSASAPPRLSAELELASALGNREVARLVQDRPGTARSVLMRSPLTPLDEVGSPPFAGGFPQGEELDWLADADSTPVDWDALAEPLPGPAQPEQLFIGAGSHAPAPPAEPKRTGHGHPSHHRRDEPLGRPAFQAGLREAWWSAWEDDIRTLVKSWNTTAPLIRAFNDAAGREELAEVHELQIGGPEATLPDLVMRQNVPRTSASRVTVGDLFTMQTASGPQPIAAQADTTGLGDNIAKAAGSEAVELRLHGIRQADNALSAAFHGFDEAQKLVSGKRHAVDAADFAIKGDEAQDRKEAAEGELAAIQEKANFVKSAIGLTLKIVETGATVLGPVMKAGSVAKAASDAGGPGIAGEAAGNDLVTMAAEQIVDWIYSSDLAAAKAKVDAAIADMRAAAKGKLKADWLSAVDEHQAALSRMLAAGDTVKEKLAARRGAYLTLASAAAKAGGGTRKEQDRVKALITAIPVVETVIAANANVLGAIVPPSYSRESGRGYSMAVYHGGEQPAQFVSHLSLLKGYRMQHEASRRLWQTRRASLLGVVDQLRAVPPDAPPPRR